MVANNAPVSQAILAVNDLVVLTSIRPLVVGAPLAPPNVPGVALIM
jgi:hypothetical protein